MLSLNSRPKPASQFYRKHRKPTSGSSRKPLGLKWRPWFPCPTPSRCVHYLQDVQKYLVIGKHVLQHLHKGLKRLWRENKTLCVDCFAKRPHNCQFWAPRGVILASLGSILAASCPPGAPKGGPIRKGPVFVTFASSHLATLWSTLSHKT